MPIIKSAKKALRQTRKRTVQNKKKKIALSFILEKIKKRKEASSLNTAFSLLDKMVKSKIIHRNKASRLKSQLANKK